MVLERERILEVSSRGKGEREKRATIREGAQRDFVLFALSLFIRGRSPH